MTPSASGCLYETLIDPWNVHMYVCIYFKTQKNIKTMIEHNKKLKKERLIVTSADTVRQTDESSS